MAHPAQFRNNTIVIVILLIVILGVWINLRAEDDKPQYIPANSPLLKQVYGICYYNKQPFTGNLYERYANGNMAKLVPYRDGLQNGLMQTWYNNRVLQLQRLFINGLKQGLHKSWWPNGLKRFEYTFKDDEYNGTVKEWYASGLLCRQFHYRMGHEDGLQQMWWENGTVRANYVVKNGQQYGLIGRKLCRNQLK